MQMGEKTLKIGIIGTGWIADEYARCFKEIDEQWNPYFQIEVLKKQLLKDE